MNKSIEIQILNKIKKAGKGVLFFAEDFAKMGSPKGVNKSLERLVAKGKLARAARGIYMRPKVDKIIGQLTPRIEDIAIAIARRDRARIAPTGTYALNRLGLSTQVPLNIIYLTDGIARKVKLGNYVITFKKTAPKNLSAVGDISKLAIQALRAIGKENVTEDDVKKIQALLMKEKPTRLEHDIRLAPAWIREIMKPVIIKMQHD